MYSGFIYKIIADDTELVYYGSTTQKLNDRFNSHKSESKRNKQKCKASELFNFPNTRIELVETLINTDKYVLKNEMKNIESNHIRNNDCVNRNIPNRTMKEYTKDNRQQVSKYMKEYMREYRKNKSSQL